MKTVVVTGASRGIGRGIAERFLEEGYRVVGASTSGEVKISHPNFSAIRVDMTIRETIRTASERLEGVRIDVLVNNAGVVLDNRANPAMDLDVLRRTFDINVFGLIEFCEANVGRIVRGGHVVNISSNWGTFSDPGFNPSCPHYKLSKAALNMYTRLLASRIEPSGVTVSAIDQGWVRSDLGGPNAPRTPREAANDVLALVTSDTSTGKLWREGRVRDW